ncbi:ABC transporter substrate-binding protein [Oceanicola sp. 22II-s10i]|uniref:ABC transporter substrate-binding protein n=1 Tax=Oceanicola sp. 22II-s10i TaxID=1317116 RepID=UPI0015950773|nr:ABC transporter substrate-binding protein [Oceanicola sp. 22II-s10i]
MIHSTRATGRPRPTRRDVLGMAAALGAGALVFDAPFARAQVKGGELRVSQYSNPSSLDPSTGRSGADHTVLWTIYDTLVDFSPDLKPMPGLAESWEWENETTLVLKLRQGVTFHDGEPFNSAAVQANFDHAKNGPRSTIRQDWASVDSVEARDDHTVALNLSEPDGALVMVLSDRAGMMASPKAIRESGEAGFDRTPVGTGQMKFVKWDDAQQVVTERNESYWREGMPHLDGITFVIITDNQTGLRSVLSGQNNFVYRVPPVRVEEVSKNPDFTTYIGPQLYVQMVYFNLSEGRGPMEDVRVRQAINYAMNKEAYNTIVTSGNGEIAHCQFPKATEAYTDEIGAMYPYDPDRAKALLKEAGFGGGLKLVSNHYSDPQSAQRMEIIAAMLEAVGITLENTVAAVAQSNKTWNEGVGDIHLSAWTGRPDPAMTLSLLFHKNAYYNKGGSEPSVELTEAIDETRRLVDAEKRMESIHRAIRLERENAMCLPMVFEPQIITHANNVKGWEPNIIGKPRYGGMWMES